MFFALTRVFYCAFESDPVLTHKKKLLNQILLLVCIFTSLCLLVSTTEIFLLNLELSLNLKFNRLQTQLSLVS